MEKYLTVKSEGFAEHKIFESKFLSYAYPFNNPEEFKERLQHLKRLHPKASHQCFAYRVGFDGNNYRSSDAGEPSGTAGRPILSQIDSHKLTNTLIIVVRYFGGILLGVSRLTNAYKTAASLVLQCTPIVEKNILQTISVECPYPKLHSVLHILKQSETSVYSQEVQLFCHLQAGIPVDNSSQIIFTLEQIPEVIVTKI